MSSIGAVHAVRHKAGAGGDEMRVGEYSIAILDAFHGQGLARMMTAALLVDCLAEGLTTLDVNILSENHAALGLVKAMGGTRKKESRGVAEYVIDVAAALEALRSDEGARGVQDVLAQLRAG